MINIFDMNILKDIWRSKSVRYTKVEFHNKEFRRYYYCSNGRKVDVLWLAFDGTFLPNFLEEKLEKEFQKEFQKEVLV